MSWEDLLAEFRALGGIADNLSLREGPRGRGLFPIDPARPVRLHVPGNLLIPVTALELRDGQLVVAAGGMMPNGTMPGGDRIGERERAFLAAYQRHFGWGSDARDALMRDQAEWARLPAAVQEKMLAAGVPEERFLPPSEQLCLSLFLKTRIIHHKGTRVVMPVMEMVNHAEGEGRYQLTDEVFLIEKTFPDEVLVSYGNADPWGCATEFGFAERTISGLSLACAVSLGNVRISIGRDLNDFNRNGTPIPRATYGDGVISIPFLVLGNRDDPMAPANHFQALIAGRGVANGDRIFNFVHRYNRDHYFELLRRLDGAPGHVAAMLRAATLYQLEAISAHY